MRTVKTPEILHFQNPQKHNKDHWNYQFITTKYGSSSFVYYVNVITESANFMQELQTKIVAVATAPSCSYCYVTTQALHAFF